MKKNCVFLCVGSLFFVGHAMEDELKKVSIKTAMEQFVFDPKHFNKPVVLYENLEEGHERLSFDFETFVMAFGYLINHRDVPLENVPSKVSLAAQLLIGPLSQEQALRVLAVDNEEKDSCNTIHSLHIPLLIYRGALEVLRG